MMVAHWARQHPPRRCCGALLATPPDFEQPMPEGYPDASTRCAPAAGCRCRASALPFPSIVAASRNDPLGSFERVAEPGARLGQPTGRPRRGRPPEPRLGLRRMAAWPKACIARARASRSAAVALTAGDAPSNEETAMANAIRFHETGGPEVLQARDGRGRRARPGPGARAPHLRRGQLHRHLLPHRPLSAAAAERPRLRRRRRGRGGRARASPTSSAGDRVGYLLGPQGAYADVRVMPADVLIPLPDGVSDRTAVDPDDEGHDGAVPVPPGLSAQGRRDHPLPRRRRRRRPDRLPVGARASASP